MNDDELSPRIEAELRRVSPAPHDIREAHLAAALAAIAPAEKKSRIPLLGIAATLLLLLGLGSTYLTRTTSQPNVVTAHAIAVVTPPKNMAPDATVPGFPHSCYLADTQTIGLYTMDTNPMQVDVTSWRVEFKNNNSCAVAAFIDIPSAPGTTDKPLECSQPIDENLTLLGTFDMTGVRYRVLSSSTDLMLYSCTTNTEVGRTPHPDYDTVLD